MVYNKWACWSHVSVASKLEYMDLNKSVHLGSLDLQHLPGYLFYRYQ
jgi:hypothetical protein